jgi:hypothetical protein
MKKIKIEAFVIMSKDRQFLATGNVRSRTITPVTEIRKGERLLTYKTEGAATSAFTKWGFYGMGQIEDGNELEAVPVNITIQERS